MTVTNTTNGSIDVGESIVTLTSSLNGKQDSIGTTSGLTLATLTASGLVSCGDLTVGGKTITTLVDEASGSGITQTDIDGKQDILEEGTNISINANTKVISTTSIINVNTLNAISDSFTSTVSNVPGEISCDSLLVGGVNITSLSSSSSSSLSLHKFQGFPKNNLDTTSIAGLTTDSNKWYGGVLADNGKIYGIPLNSESVLIIDPETNTADNTTITGLSGFGKWVGGVLAPNGKIYCIPYFATNVLIIDPETNTVDTTTISGLSGGWYGGVLHPNGKIYGIPNNSGVNILIIDPETNTADTTSITGSSDSSWRGGVLAPNGLIYAIPWTAQSVMIINPYTNTIDTTTISGFSTTTKWLGGVLAQNGKIYGIPYRESNVLIIDPDTNTIDTTSISTGNNGTSAFHGGTLAENGKIYCIPHFSSKNVVVIDPETNTTETIIGGLTDIDTKYGGGVLAPNGKIYSIPINVDNVLIINTGLPKYPDWMLQAYFNKF